MSIYRTFETDPQLEQEGIKLHYGFTNDGRPVKIRVARAGGANKRFAKILEEESEPYRRAIETGQMDGRVADEVMQRVYARAIVLGWENVEDENDEPMECTFDNVMKLFNDLPDLWHDLRTQAGKNALYRKNATKADSGN